MGRAIRRIKPPTYVKCPEGAGRAAGSRYGPHPGDVCKVISAEDFTPRLGWCFEARFPGEGPEDPSHTCLTHGCAYLRNSSMPNASWIYCDKNGRPRDRQPERDNPLG